MSSPDTTLEAIRQRRETRDRLVLQHSIPLLEHLKNMVQDWIDGEFRDLEDLILQVDYFASRDSASDRINRFRVELSQIRSDKLPKATKELDELIDYIKSKSFESAEETARLLGRKIQPIISVVFELTRARDRLDGMADMIQIPVPTPVEVHDDDDEEEEQRR
jgi:hypothetical protein